ncbi:MAG: type II toxin-antitoxin system RelE/ParE family toxin [Gemmatimonadales bacterium]
MNVEYHPLAMQELVDAAQFYEKRAAGLGGRFIAAVDATNRLLSRQPGIGRPGTATVRTFPIRRFPYSVVYQTRGEGLIILAVAHQRRRPAYWTGRDR